MAEVRRDLCKPRLHDARTFALHVCGNVRASRLLGARHFARHRDSDPLCYHDVRDFGQRPGRTRPRISTNRLTTRRSNDRLFPIDTITISLIRLLEIRDYTRHAKYHDNCVINVTVHVIGTYYDNCRNMIITIALILCDS